MVKSDSWLLQAIQQNALLYPALAAQQRVNAFGNKAISAGVTSAGYDLRLSLQSGLKMITHQQGSEIDPKRFDADKLLIDLALQYDSEGSPYWLLPPGACVLGLSTEYFTMPSDIVAVCTGKSTYARCGVIVNTTPVEPGWEGYLVLELINANKHLPVRVYADEGIAQVVFHELDQTCSVSYAARAGKYHKQQEITAAKL